MTSPQDRRRFMRVPFDTTITLHQGHHHWQCELVDLSLRGALLLAPEGCKPTDAPLTLSLSLGKEAQISMCMSLAHQQGQQLGLTCEQIDVDSIAHLRRLIELNSGDPAAAERELKLLGAPT